MHMVNPEYPQGASERALLKTKKGLWVVRWSFVGLMLTALLQAGVVLVSSSAGLLADTIHNAGDALTAVPLWIAFRLAHLKPNKKFTYGYGRAEDLVGLLVLIAIIFSAVFCAHTSIQRLLNPKPVESVLLVAVAAFVGYLGNEWVASLRIRVGKEIGSTTLVAEGNHARVDALTSLAVVLGMVGVWFGFPMADPLVGLLISLMITKIAWETGKSVLNRFMDVVEESVIDQISHSALAVQEVLDVSEVRARWIGHSIHTEVNLAVSGEMTVADAHNVADSVRDAVLVAVPHLSQVVIHIDPHHKSGEKFHKENQ